MDGVIAFGTCDSTFTRTTEGEKGYHIYWILEDGRKRGSNTTHEAIGGRKEMKKEEEDTKDMLMLLHRVAWR